MKVLSHPRSYSILCLLGALTFLSGCASSFTTNSGIDYPAPSPLNNGTGDVQGGAFGGRQPIQGSHLFMFGAPITVGTYSVPTSGNATGTTTTVAPISLLGNNGGCNASQNLYLDTSGGATNGLCYYLTGTGTETFTNNNTAVGPGEFNLTGLYKCNVDANGNAVTGQQVWIYSVGGDPGGNGTSTPNVNPAAGLAASLGTCPGTTFAGTLSYIYMNEVSTTAFAYATAGFAYDALHISAPTTNTVGLGNAFANAAQLYDIAGGVDPGNHSGARYKTPNGFGSNPYVLINSVANVIAGCINSNYSQPTNTNGISTSCNAILYSNNGTGSQIATDTVSAAIYIAQHPSNAAIFSNVGIYKPWHPSYGDASPYTNPYNGVSAAVPAFPNDLTAAILFTGSGYLQPTGIAAAANGHVFVTMGSTSASGSIADITPVGAISNSATVNGPTSIVIDSLGDLWSVGATNGNLYEISNSGGTPTISGTVNSYFAGSFSQEAPPQLPLALAAGGTPGGTPATVYVADYAAVNSTGASGTPGVVDKVTYTGGTPTLTRYDRVGTSPFVTFKNASCPNNVNGIAIDNSANLWTSNSSGFVCRTKTIAGGTGSTIAVNFGATGLGEVASLSGLAVDYPGNAWASSPTGLVYVTAAGSGSKVLSAGGLERPSVLTIDGNGNVFAINGSAYAYNASCSASYPPSITEYSAIGSSGPSAISPSAVGTTYCGGYQTGQLSFPNGIAVDISGNLWITNSVVNTSDPYNNTVTELIGAATPTLSPTLQTPGKPEVKTGTEDTIE